MWQNFKGCGLDIHQFCITIASFARLYPNDATGYCFSLQCDRKAAPTLADCTLGRAILIYHRLGGVDRSLGLSGIIGLIVDVVRIPSAL